MFVCAVQLSVVVALVVAVVCVPTDNNGTDNGTNNNGFHYLPISTKPAQCAGALLVCKKANFAWCKAAA